MELRLFVAVLWRITLSASLSRHSRSVVIVCLQWLNQLQNYSTLANTHRSLGTRPRQDYTDSVMLNDCVSARWSPMYQYLALTSLRDSHRLPTRHIREPGNVRRLFFSLPYFRFRTSVSVLRFPYFGFRTSLARTSYVSV